jgi:hypothetical protein
MNLLTKIRDTWNSDEEFPKTRRGKIIMWILFFAALWFTVPLVPT